MSESTKDHQSPPGPSTIEPRTDKASVPPDPAELDLPPVAPGEGVGGEQIGSGTQRQS